MALLVTWMPRFAAHGDDPGAVWVERGRAAGFIRAARRRPRDAPAVPAESLVPVPAALVLERPPRYAQRKCAPRI